jgi:hypothetical protein
MVLKTGKKLLSINGVDSEVKIKAVFLHITNACAEVEV